MSAERSTMRKVYWRLLPLTILTYFLCYLDRINIGFAALTMNKDLGLDAATYGMAAGAFFWGYFLFESSEQHHPGKGPRARAWAA
jgi:MFS transporter, ACS family, tartrate transporter